MAKGTMIALPIAVAVGLLTMIAATTAQAQTPTTAQDLTAIFRQFTDAVNAGDVDVALATFTEDATWVRGGRCPPGGCTGQAAIRGELEKDVADHHRIDIVDTQVSGSTLTARVELRTDGTRAAGVERIIQMFTVEFRGDKMSALRARPDLTDSQTAAFAAPRAPATGFGPQPPAGPALPLTLTLSLLVAGGLLTTFSFGMRAGRRKR